jgi:hypothetical protein
MHAFEHGVAMQIIKAIIRALRELEITLGLNSNTLISRLSRRLRNLRKSPSVCTSTLLGFVNQSVLDLFATINADGKIQSVMPDASDVQQLMLVLPFVLDGLASREIAARNVGRAPAQKLVDPVFAIINVLNQYLQWYLWYRSPAKDIDEGELTVLQLKGEALVTSLKKVFPYTYTVKKAGGSTFQRSWWCTEKVHSITHCHTNFRKYGQCRNMCAQVASS